MHLIRKKKLFFFVCLTIAILNLQATTQQDASEPENALPIGALNPEQEVLMAKNQQKFEYQSDIARLMKVVVSHLYHDRDVFLRELISNSGDALEKLRFASLTDPQVLDTAPALNISIIADKPTKRLIIRDSGVGMTKEELQKNLGTIARSGTSEFLSKLEKSPGNDKAASPTSSNLIGQFGLGFYSSFLVADRVLVSSKSNADDRQWVFESSADAAEFKISEDPRGPSLGRGTEITLHMKDDALEFLDVDKLKGLISTHSEYSTTAPIYVWTEKEVEVPVEEDPRDEEKKEEKDSSSDDQDSAKDTEKEDLKSKDSDKDSKSEDSSDDSKPKDSGDGDDKMEIDEDDDAESKEEDSKPKTKTVKLHDWEQINTKGPIWSRDPKTVTDEEYIEFYKASVGKSEEPTSWTHFKGDAGRTSFHGLIYVPSSLPADFYTKTYAQLDSVRLFVRKVLITKEPSPDFIPKWLNWLKVFIDADDLPLNVGRDSLQVTKSLRQIQNIVLKKFLDHLANLTKKQPEKYLTLWKKIGTTLKVGAVEDAKHRDKLAKLLRFSSSYSTDKLIGLEEYVARRKKNQKQIYFIAGTGVEVKDLSKSPFVEKLVARGYEVLYLTEPMDEMLTQSLTTFDGLRFQDVAKKGLEMGDEEDDEDEKKELADFKTKYEPLSKWIKKELDEFVSDVVISNRLTTSPCAVVTDSYAWTGNMERLMAAQSQQNGGDQNFMLDFLKKAKKTFEINPKHPLIQGLLEKVEEAGEDDLILLDEMKHVIRVLWDTSLVRSGFTVADTNTYFERIELLLRKSVGVDESEKVNVGEIKPAPPVEEGPVDPRPKNPEETTGDAGKVQINSDGTTQKVDESQQDWKDWSKVKEELKEGSGTAKEEPETEKKHSSDKKATKEDDGDDDEEDEEADFDPMDDGKDPFEGLDMPGLEKMKEELMRDFGGLRDEL